MKNEERKICGEGFVEVRLHYGKKILPYIEWEGFVRKDSFSFCQKKAWLFPMWEEFAEKDSCALQVEESLTPSPCGEGFVGGIAVHLGGKRKFHSFPIALYFWARQFDSFPMWGRIYREGKLCI